MLGEKSKYYWQLSAGLIKGNRGLFRVECLQPQPLNKALPGKCDSIPITESSCIYISWAATFRLRFLATKPKTRFTLGCFLLIK
jgi:hypothetical protein